MAVSETRIETNGLPRLPHGVRAAGTACGIKSDGAPDLGLIAFDSPAQWAGVFTTNAAAAAPVRWCKQLLGAPVQALVVNSGNANACTGRDGERAVEAAARCAASALGCDPRAVLVASTGPIGVTLPLAPIAAGIPQLAARPGTDLTPFATAIMTTDTVAKLASASAGEAVLVGAAKGAAMLAPNMATMLAFVVTDAAIDSGVMQSALSEAVANSFNRISLDACESTNDSVFLFSTGRTKDVSAGVFGKALAEVCSELAEMIVRDAEGGSKLVRIKVRGASDDDAAAVLAKAVAASSLWRAAAGGGDPNWGRVVAAMGSTDVELDLKELSVGIGGVPLYLYGAPCGNEARAAVEMAGDEFIVECTVGRGPGCVEVLSADLTSAYVELNARGST
jgi:glutamate N-acetyltransferase/amino-acid N-acetyltransferase